MPSVTVLAQAVAFLFADCYGTWSADFSLLIKWLVGPAVMADPGAMTGPVLMAVIFSP